MQGYDVGMVCLIGATSVNRMPCQPRGCRIMRGGGGSGVGAERVRGRGILPAGRGRRNLLAITRRWLSLVRESLIMDDYRAPN